MDGRLTAPDHSLPTTPWDSSFGPIRSPSRPVHSPYYEMNWNKELNTKNKRRCAPITMD